MTAQETIIPSKAQVRAMDVAAPRYTSYPTIPVWHATDSGNEYAKALRTDPAEIPLTLYFHVPFCPTICHYCGCNTAKLKSPQETADYVATLLDEIRLVRNLFAQKRRVTQIHWGGGTPSVLQENEFHAVFRLIRESFDVSENAEWAIETNPMTCDNEKLRFLLNNGFNRLSIGVQDFDPEVQQSIGRFQTHERTLEFCGIIREHGVRSLNFDLVYGLPGQTLEKADATFEKVAAIHPDRIAVYSFAFLPTLRDNQKQINTELLPESELKFDLYLLAIRRLQQAGYDLIGMDHYALPHDELAVAARERRLRRNFMGYTTGAETNVLAFGATAISDVSGYYCQNEKEIESYRARVRRGDLPIQRHLLLDDDDRIRRKTIMDMLCNGVIMKDDVSNLFGIFFDAYFAEEVRRLQPLADNGLLRYDAHSIESTPLGRFFLRNLALIFDNYLDGRKGPRRDTTFSRTV